MLWLVTWNEAHNPFTLTPFLNTNTYWYKHRWQSMPSSLHDTSIATTQLLSRHLPKNVVKLSHDLFKSSQTTKWNLCSSGQKMVCTTQWTCQVALVPATDSKECQKVATSYIMVSNQVLNSLMLNPLPHMNSIRSIDIYNTKNYKAVNTYEQVFWFPLM